MSNLDESRHQRNFGHGPPRRQKHVDDDEAMPSAEERAEMAAGVATDGAALRAELIRRGVLRPVDPDSLTPRRGSK
jgi:hypothetical protein